MHRRLTNAPLLAGLIVSIVIHVLVLAPLLAAAMSPVKPGSQMESRFDPEDFRRPREEEPELEPEDQPVPLGLDEGSTSTLDWVGHEEYEEHLARLADFNQAAFTDTPLGGPTMPPVPEVAPTETPPIQPDATASAVGEPEQATATEDVVEEQVDPTQQQAEVVANAEPPMPESPLPTIDDLTPVTEADLAVAEAEQFDEETRDVPPVEEGADTPESSSPNRTTNLAEALQTLARRVAEMQPEQPPEQPPTEPAEVAAPAQPQEPQPPQPPSESPEPVPGDQADKQSDATSTIDVPIDQIKIGKPLAAEGLELKPRRPSFTTLQRLTIAPCNPLVEVRFGRDGRPRAPVSILQSSGDPSVDSAVRSSLYGWRASGKPLAALAGEETIDIVLRIVLSSRECP